MAGQIQPGRRPLEPGGQDPVVPLEDTIVIQDTSSLSSSVLSLLQSTRTVLQKAHDGHAAVDVVFTGKFQVPFYSNTVIVQKL